MEKLMESTLSTLSTTPGLSLSSSSTGVSPVQSCFKSITSFKMYKRNAPHYELPGSFYFITFRTINKFSLNEQSKNIIFDAIKFHDNRKYKIYSFVIMPDHAHLICQPLEKSPHGFYSLEEISHSLKSFSAKEINKILGREGTLWQNERFDRLIRDEDELKEKIDYIIKNPVKAELVKAPEDYRWLYYIDWRI